MPSVTPTTMFPSEDRRNIQPSAYQAERVARVLATKGLIVPPDGIAAVSSDGYVVEFGAGDAVMLPPSAARAIRVALGESLVYECEGMGV